MRLLRRITGNLLLLALIIFIVWRYILPVVYCWREGGTWDKGTCSIVYELPGEGMIPTVDEVRNAINLSRLRELTLEIPNATNTSATLSRTEDALEKFVATFSQGGSSGSAEALANLAVTDTETGFALIPFVVNYGGTGSFVYVGLFANEGGVPVHKDSLLLGDRVKLERVSFGRENGTLRATAEILDRKEGEPMVAVPTERVRISVDITGTSFGESVRTGSEDTAVVTHKDLVRVFTPTPGSTVSSPMKITGEARGNWFFEASFPITITDWDGRIIGEGVATADGEWMTTEYVSFTASIPYDLPADTAYRRGTVIIKKDNPSGMPENDDAFEIQVNFK